MLIISERKHNNYLSSFYFIQIKTLKHKHKILHTGPLIVKHPVFPKEWIPFILDKGANDWHLLNALIGTYSWDIM